MKGTCGFCVRNWNPQSEKKNSFSCLVRENRKLGKLCPVCEHENSILLFISQMRSWLTSYEEKMTIKYA